MSGREWLCYTDGSSKAASGARAPAGGWGFHVRPPNGAAIEGSGGALGALAKVMEYRAVAEALAVLPEGVSAVVFSDNQSLVENLTKSLRDWERSAFANVDPLIVESARQIAKTIAERRLSVRWQWVRGHNGNAGNERADALAAAAAREQKAILERRR